MIFSAVTWSSMAAKPACQLGNVGSASIKDWWTELTTQNLKLVAVIKISCQ